MTNPLLDELRAIGCKVALHASRVGGLRFELAGTADYTTAFANQVAHVFIRHRYREVREGMWVPEGATEEQIRETVEEMGEEAEYKRLRQDVAAIDAEHPDWTDEQIAHELSIDPRDISHLRY